jgi:hypothetical protein
VRAILQWPGPRRCVGSSVGAEIAQRTQPFHTPLPPLPPSFRAFSPTFFHPRSYGMVLFFARLPRSAWVGKVTEREISSPRVRGVPPPIPSHPLSADPLYARAGSGYEYLTSSSYLIVYVGGSSVGEFCVCVCMRCCSTCNFVTFLFVFFDTTTNGTITVDASLSIV